MPSKGITMDRNDTTVELLNPSTCENFGQERLKQPGLVLKFEHLNLKIKGTNILSDISGCARPGKILAVMGPSGSGKTTLLNVIGGRMKCPGCKATIGGQPLNKKNRRKISYVLQEDIFFPNLTLGDTLMFSAELRLEESWPRSVKELIVQEIVDQLEIANCMKTIIGSPAARGLSGGEKKRANIANELLTDPAVLLLDEPTSGLDSTTAFGLVKSLKLYAVEKNKTVLLSVHQPSSQMFFLFDTIMLMSRGQIAYYGSPENVLHHFSNIGYSSDIPHYNPADFILDMAKMDLDDIDHIVAECNHLRAKCLDCPILKSTLMSEKSRVSTDLVPDSVSFEPNNSLLCLPEKGNVENGIEVSAAISRDDSLKQGDIIFGEGVDEDTSDVNNDNNNEYEDNDKSWITSFWKQLKVLTHRSYIQGKSRYLSKLRFIKCFGVSLIVGLVWWQIGAGYPEERKISDISALLFFSTLYNSFNPLFDVLQIFPSERTVINKERMAGAYRLSAYYLGKLASELPLSIIFPSIYTLITYWMAGLNGINNIWAFFGSWLVILCQAFASQSLGLFISSATMDFDHGLVMAVLIMISFMLLGGFYIKNIPPWLTWSRYISPVTHAWALSLYLEFDSDSRILCDPNLSAYESCQFPTSNTSYIHNEKNNISSADNVTRYVAHQEILMKNEIYESPLVAVVSLLIIMTIFRLLGYYCLRLLHRPVMK